MVTVDCIADLHGHYPQLEGGDLLIVAGDLTARDTIYEHADFLGWLNAQDYKKKIFIAGNHDNKVDKKFDWEDSIHYLCDSGIEFEYLDNIFPEKDEKLLPCGYRTLKIWGSPWTKRFKGINPNCMAFTVDTEEELADKFEKIPDDIDILITHGPPWGILDENGENVRCGSSSLQFALSRIQPKLHIFGHIHEAYGRIEKVFICTSPKHKVKRPHVSVNCSHVNEHYEPVNKPVRIVL